MSASAAALRQLLEDANPAQSFRAYAGYAGWGPGQLDGELDRGDWQLWWADRDTVFSDQGVELWRKLLRESSERWVRQQFAPLVASKTLGEPEPVVAILAANDEIVNPRALDHLEGNLVTGITAGPQLAIEIRK